MYNEVLNLRLKNKKLKGLSQIGEKYKKLLDWVNEKPLQSETKTMGNPMKGSAFFGNEKNRLNLLNAIKK